MSLYALADLHLGRAAGKPMDKFGENWRNHDLKIEKNWKAALSSQDTIILPGDISWAMRLKEAKFDLDFLQSLPGKKVLLRGNHDFWWSSVSQLEKAYPSFFFLQNNFYPYGNIAICGSRGWLCPGAARFQESDQKIYERELARLRLSLNYAIKAGFQEIIVVLHFPPTNEQKAASGFTLLFQEYPQIKQVIYGHLHGEASFYTSLQGDYEGLQYHLVSSDYVNFQPKKMID